MEQHSVFVSQCPNICALNRRRDITSVWTNWHCISQLHPLLPRTVRSNATSAPHADTALTPLCASSLWSVTRHSCAISPSVCTCGPHVLSPSVLLDPQRDLTVGAHITRLPSAWRSLSSSSPWLLPCREVRSRLALARPCC